MPLSDQDSYNSFVQRGLDTQPETVSGNYITIVAGPPQLGLMGSTAVATPTTRLDDLVYPVGVIQNFNLGQNRNFSRIFELGSDRSYFIPGRTVGQVGLSRVHYHGPSLLRVLYAYFVDIVPPTQVDWLWPNVGAMRTLNPHDVRVSPGYDNLLLNLASDMFAQPIGLGFFVRDSSLQTLGAFYLERCYIPSSTWATDAMGTLVQESVALQYERLVPIKVRSIPLITGISGSSIPARVAATVT